MKTEAQPNIFTINGDITSFTFFCKGFRIIECVQLLIMISFYNGFEFMIASFPATIGFYVSMACVGLQIFYLAYIYY